jgi:hypothetical protein
LAAARQIRCYRGAHVTEADKPNMALQRRTPARGGARSLPVRKTKAERDSVSPLSIGSLLSKRDVHVRRLESSINFVSSI